MPHALIVGAIIPSPMTNAALGTSKCASSWLKMTCCIDVPLRPPYSGSQGIFVSPASNFMACHLRARARSSAPPTSMKSALDPVTAGALSSSHVRYSARHAASSGLSLKSMRVSRAHPAAVRHLRARIAV